MTMKKNPPCVDVDKIRALCRHQGTSLSWLERKLEIGNGNISKWKYQDPRIYNVKKVADYFKRPLDFFIK